MIEITFYPNGLNMAFLDDNQIKKAQKSWLIVYAEYLNNIGIDPTEQQFILPNGRIAKIFRIRNNQFAFEIIRQS